MLYPPPFDGSFWEADRSFDTLEHHIYVCWDLCTAWPHWIADILHGCFHMSHDFAAIPAIKLWFYNWSDSRFRTFYIFISDGTQHFLLKLNIVNTYTISLFIFFFGQFYGSNVRLEWYMVHVHKFLINKENTFSRPSHFKECTVQGEWSGEA